MEKMRGPRPLRALRQGIEDRDTRVSRTEYLEDEPFKQALEQFLPQIAAETEQATKTVRTPFLYFRRKRAGRRCSCFDVETSPDGFCQICFGTGLVGGWEMHGTRSEWIDITHPELKLVNVKGSFDDGHRPVGFVLEDGQRKGYVEVEVPLVRNVRKTQKLHYVVGQQRIGTSVKFSIRSAAELTFVPLSEETLNTRLHNSSVIIRMEIERSNTALPSPKLSHLMLRYQLIPDVKLIGDVNLAEETFELGDLGFTDSFSTMSLVVSKTYDRLQTEDFMVRLTDNKRFKVTRSERNVVLEVLLSHTLYSRLLIPGTDSLVTYP